MKLKIVLLIIFAIIIIATGYYFSSSVFGGQVTIATSFYEMTEASFTCPTTATTTNPILSLDADRKGFRVTNRSNQSMFLHMNAQATTTNVAVNQGEYLSGDGLTTSTKTWVQIEGGKGYVYCISPVAASGTVISWK